MYFFCVSLCSTPLLLAYMYSGDTNEANLLDERERFTLLNALGNYYLMWGVFGVSTLVAVMGHVFIYLFM